MNKYKQLTKLKKFKKICLISHKEPDPDALSSMVAFREFLINKFKVPQVLIYADYETLSPQCAEIIENIEINTNEEGFDCAILLDAPNIERAGAFSYKMNIAPFKVVIDHHNTNELKLDINIVEETSSTCELVYDIMKNFKYTPSYETKGKLYAGLITDTGNFTVGNFGSRSFKMASDYVDEIDNTSIYKAFLMNTSLKNFKVLGYAIQNISTHLDNKLIITYISKQQAEELNLTADDYLGIVNDLNTIKEANIVCFCQPRENGFYVSMRAKEGFNVAEIAKLHNGGGHVGAAAFTSELSIEELKKYLSKEFDEQLTTIERKRKTLFYKRK